MSILTVDVGRTDLTVQCQRGGHAAPRRVGTMPTSHAGRATSSIRAELMVVPVVLVDYSPTIVATIRSLFALGAQVACSGDVFNNGGATIVCSATFSDDFSPAGPWFGLSMTLYEVGSDLAYSTPVEAPVGDEVSDGWYWWYDAQSLAGLGNGDTMDTWTDISGNSRTATADATWVPYRPTYTTNAIHGHPAVQFQLWSGNGRAFSMPGQFSVPGNVTEAHLFIVCAPQVSSPPYHLGSNAFGPSFPASGTDDITDHFGSTVSRAVGAPGVATSAGFIYHAHAKSAVWEADVGLTNKVSSGTNTIEWGGQKLGGWYAGGYYAYVFQGYIGEFKVWKGAMSAGTVTTEITNLGTKWGITV